MVCEKCGYKDKKEVKKMGMSFCSVCATFVPEDKKRIEKYISEKIDWRDIDSFRRCGQLPGAKQKSGMQKKALSGALVTRAPFGYDVMSGKLIPNEDSVKVHSLYKTFLNKNYSLNALSKKYGLSVNGLKKILQNRTYLGEIKFDGQLHKSEHKALLSPEIFYAVQRKLQTYLRPRKNETNKYILNKTVEPFKEKDINVIEEPKEIIDKSESLNGSHNQNFGSKKKTNDTSDGLYKSIFD